MTPNASCDSRREMARVNRVESPPTERALIEVASFVLSAETLYREAKFDNPSSHRASI